MSGHPVRMPSWYTDNRMVWVSDGPATRVPTSWPEVSSLRETQASLNAESPWQFARTSSGLLTPLQPTQPPFRNAYCYISIFFVFVWQIWIQEKSYHKNLYKTTINLNHHFHMLSTEICHRQNNSLRFPRHFGMFQISPRCSTSSLGFSWFPWKIHFHESCRNVGILARDY